MITVGNIEISDVWVGNQPVSEIWLGNQLVWPTVKDYLLDEKGQIISGIDPNNTYGPNTLTYIRADGFERVKGVKYEIDQSKCIDCGA